MLELGYFLQQCLNGLSLGMLYGLIALGYTMVYGIVGMINFAHGEIFMISAFLAFLAFVGLQDAGVMSITLCVLGMFLFSMAITAVYGYALEAVAYKPLRSAPRLAPLITAIGMSILFQNFVQLTQGAQVKALPPLLTGTNVLGMFDHFAVTLSDTQIVLFISTVVTAVVLYAVIHKTPLGRAQRACAQDAKMASLLGISVNRVIAITFMMGAVGAAVAGVMVTLYYGVLDFYMGFLVGMKAFTAAVLGGIGSLEGAVLGGVLLGLIETLWSAYFGADYKNVAAFGVLIFVLMVRPTGLLGRPTLEKV